MSNEVKVIDGHPLKDETARNSIEQLQTTLAGVNTLIEALQESDTATAEAITGLQELATQLQEDIETLQEKADNALMADGSVAMSGDLIIDNNSGTTSVKLRTQDGAETTNTNEGKHLWMSIRDVAGSANYRSLRLGSQSVLDIKSCLQIINKVDGIGTGYQLFGEHNKPSGSYTGNGSATSRTIPFDNISKVVIVLGGGGLSFLISGVGGFTIGIDNAGITSHKTNAYCGFTGIVLQTDSGYLNANGVEYSYFSL